MSFVQDLLSDPSVPLRARQHAFLRAYADPGIPDPNNTTKPFWLKDPHSESNQVQSRSLPTETDVTIIGSGISGASIAKTLLESTRGSIRVTILEARDICSGATGRNGGHILETGDDYDEFVRIFGIDGARRIMRFRLAHLEELMGVVEGDGVVAETQARRVQFLSAYFDDEAWLEALRKLRRFKEGMPEESREFFVYEEKKKRQPIPTARGIIAGPAGAIWPYKLVTSVLSRLKREYQDVLGIETNTPVTVITVNKQGNNAQRKYTLETPRGSIKSTHIIHATNAHAAHHLPGLRGKTYPIRGQMSAQTPGSNFPDYSRKHSWIFSYDRGFDYLTQLLPREESGSASDNEMMYGGAFAQGIRGGIEEIGIATDSELSMYCDIHLSGALRAVFRENWGVSKEDPVKSMWTGNMGFSSDGLPWVGRVSGLGLTGRDDDEQEARITSSGAEWLSAAFSGEGMVHAWLCGKAVARMLLLHEGRLTPGQADGDLSWFPPEMLVTKTRVKETGLGKTRRANDSKY